MTNYKNIDLEEGLIGMIRHMQAVDECRDELNNLQSVWDNLTLLGQLSGTGTDMNGTRQSFQKLTGSLLNQLASETLRKCVSEMTSKAQVAIDILVRNLFERTADIGFLATDDDICAVLRDANSLKGKYSRKQELEAGLSLLRERFSEYVAKYSVYSDVVLLDIHGEILIRLKDTIGVERTQHPLLQLSLETPDGYVETFDRVDFLPEENCSLIYSFRVVDGENKALGVLCLCFRFDNELKGIFANLVAPDDWSVITLLDSEGRVIASSDIYHVPLGAKLTPVLDREYRAQRFAGQEYLASTRCSSGYQGYAGPKWYAHVMLPLQHAFNRDSSGLLKNIPQESLDTIMERSQLFSESLRNIPQHAELIQRDLNRSVWNGNVRQCRFGKAKDTGFSKILLWEISNTGARTQAVFQRSIANLHETVVSSVLEDSRFQASLAIDIMDRNLYERANDCRWWALTSSFRELLSEGEVSDAGRARISSILAYINSLYTVYTNLIVFDAGGRIVAVSNPGEISLVGQSVGEEWQRRVLMLPDSQGYAVSDFIETRFYQGRHTYIYGAAIRDSEGARVVGGIGIVFDSAPQFSAMLRDALPKDAEGQIDSSSFGVFVSRDGRVLACSDDRFNPGERLTISPALCNLSPGEEMTDVISLKGHYYAIGAHASSGYREYKSESDSYSNEVIALVGKELCAMTENRGETETALCPMIRSDRGRAETTVEIATFRLGHEWFGIRANQIMEAVDTVNITPAPGAGADCVGYLMYEGLPMPVFDVRNRICTTRGDAEPVNRKAQQVIVIEKNESTRFGVIADALGEIPEVHESRMNTLPAVIGGGALLADAAIAPDKPDEECLLLVLSSERLAQKLASSMTEPSLATPRNVIDHKKAG
ncbi:chemotaxis protein CheW [Methylobacter sp.]|uniref:chemotaxis protein CheW n=1 Tax=Methylobacter sp. TaxID=2051955 RepID=UPI002FDD03AF